MNCPACHETLVVVEREGIELDWCLKCRGLWFDEGELELLAEQVGRRLEGEDVGRAPDRPPKSQRRKCPRCRKWMDPVVVGAPETVHVDRCPDHGIWLDRGELGRIMGQLDAGRVDDEQVIMQFLGETFGKASEVSNSSEEGDR